MRSILAFLLIVCPLICVAQDADSLPIRQGDQLRVSVRREPDLTISEFVSSDGSIFLPLINEVKVAGLTVQEAEKLLAKKLRPFVANPEVTVMILNRPKQQTLPSMWPFVKAARSLIVTEHAG
jgi:polysaccharide export outer membrane protein